MRASADRATEPDPASGPAAVISAPQSTGSVLNVLAEEGDSVVAESPPTPELAASGGSLSVTPICERAPQAASTSTESSPPNAAGPGFPANSLRPHVRHDVPLPLPSALTLARHSPRWSPRWCHPNNAFMILRIAQTSVKANVLFSLRACPRGSAYPLGCHRIKRVRPVQACETTTVRAEAPKGCLDVARALRLGGTVEECPGARTNGCELGCYDAQMAHES